MTLIFSDFQESEGIKYALEIGVSQESEKRRLTLHYTTSVFNKVIPEQIFMIDKPPAFETRILD